MTSFKSWLRCLLVVCICCTTGVHAEEIDTSDLHRSSAVYGDASRTDHVLQTLDIYQKRSDIRANPQRTKPVVIYIHGGGWFFGDKADVYAKPASFLSHDMLFVSANCRLQDAGSEVLIIPANSKTRDTIDQELGIREDTTSLALMAFLRAKL